VLHTSYVCVVFGVIRGLFTCSLAMFLYDLESYFAPGWLTWYSVADFMIFSLFHTATDSGISHSSTDEGKAWQSLDCKGDLNVQKWVSIGKFDNRPGNLAHTIWNVYPTSPATSNDFCNTLLQDIFAILMDKYAR